MNQPSARYTKTAVILHWLIALGIFGMFALGWYMSELPKEAPKQIAFDLFDLGIYTWQLAEEASRQRQTCKRSEGYGERESREGIAFAQTDESIKTIAFHLTAQHGKQQEGEQCHGQISG